MHGLLIYRTRQFKGRHSHLGDSAKSEQKFILAVASFLELAKVTGTVIPWARRLTSSDAG
jgi:hypothetical protein